MNQDDLSTKSPSNWQPIASNIDDTLKQKEVQDAPFGYFSDCFLFLPITWRQKAVLAKIYAFQRAGGAFHMSLASAAQKFNLDRRNLKKDLDTLVKQGYLEKKSNGERRPATYRINEVVCWNVATTNGWEPPEPLEEDKN